MSQALEALLPAEHPAAAVVDRPNALERRRMVDSQLSLVVVAESIRDRDRLVLRQRRGEQIARRKGRPRQRKNCEEA